jgi:hypothetical protein
MDVWDFVLINSDVAICLQVGGELVWRLANVEGIRRLKVEPKSNTSLASCETECYPSKVLLNDAKCAFHVRYYRECSVDGDILQGFQNAHHACLWKAKCAKKCSEHSMESCHKCCKEPVHGRTFYLPMHEQRTIANEPVVEIPACIVLDTVSMVKMDNHRNLWLLGCGNKQLVLDKFKASGGVVPLPDGAAVKKKPVKVVKKAPPKQVRRVAKKTDATPPFHALNQHMHQGPLENLLGCSIHVYWPIESSWFLGIVSKFHMDAVNMQVLYIDDGDQKYHDLRPGGCLWGLHSPHTAPVHDVQLGDGIDALNNDDQQDSSLIRPEAAAHPELEAAPSPLKNDAHSDTDGQQCCLSHCWPSHNAGTLTMLRSQCLPSHNAGPL